MSRKKDIREKIIIPSRKIIKEDGNIKKYYIFPGLLSVIFLTGLLSYQSIYTYVKLGHNEEFLLSILNFIETKYIIEALIFGVIFLVIYFLVTPIFDAGLIKYIDYKEKGEKLSKSETFGQGLHKFLPMFEYSNFFSEFKLISILNFYLFTIRFVGTEYIQQVNLFYIVVFCFSLVINILLVYSKYFMILEDSGIFNSIGKSMTLTILNPKKTIRLFFMMFLLNVRIILNFVIFLFFPIFIAIAISLISTKIWLILAITFISIVFMFLVLIVSYLSAVLEIFKTSLWYYAYLDGKNTIEKLKKL